MNRFPEMFARRRGRGGALIPFLMLGDPDAEGSLRLAEAALEAGADALELGIPFSDPLADGPTIQRSAARALAAGSTVEGSLALVEAIRRGTRVPIGLLVYYNLIHRAGVGSFCERVARAGADAVLAADLPIEESRELEAALEARGLGCVHLVAPNTPGERAVAISRRASAFTYVVSTYGTTGARERLEGDVCARVKGLRASCEGALAVGFGISRPGQARALVEAGADGVIVGSALIALLEQHPGDVPAAAAAVGRRIRELRGKEAQESC